MIQRADRGAAAARDGAHACRAGAAREGELGGRVENDVVAVKPGARHVPADNRAFALIAPSAKRIRSRDEHRDPRPGRFRPHGRPALARAPGPAAPTDLPLPPDSRLPLLGPGRRIRKKWRYVGVFCDEFLLCAARAQVGIVGQTFWAIVDRETGEMTEQTRKHPPFGRGEVWSLAADRSAWPLGSDDDGVVTWIDSKLGRAELRIGAGRWVESVCPTEEGGWVWTRKRIAPVECDVRMPGRPALAHHGLRDRGRIGRLPPAPHGLGLVRGRRCEWRRPRRRLEPGQRCQRSPERQRTGDLGRRRAARARPGQLRRRPRRHLLRRGEPARVRGGGRAPRRGEPRPAPLQLPTAVRPLQRLTGRASSSPRVSA